MLSGYYVSSFLAGNSAAQREYKYLSERVEEDYLYPFPDQQLLGRGDSSAYLDLQNEFIQRQKNILIRKFGLVINLFQEKYRGLFNQCIPVPEGKNYTEQYYNNSSASYAARKADGMLLRNKKALARYISALQELDYPYNYLEGLNCMINAAYLLDCVHGHENAVLSSISTAVLSSRETLLRFREKIEDGTKFTVDTYNDLLDFSFDDLTGEFFGLLVKYSSEYISQRNDIVSMNDAEMNLREFCIQQGFDSPSDIYDTANDADNTAEIRRPYLGIELIEEGVLTSVVNDRYDEISRTISQYRETLCTPESGISLLMSSQEEFDRYFIRLGIRNKRDIRRKTVAILDDETSGDHDLLFTTEGIMPLIKEKMKKVVQYDDIEVNPDRTVLFLHQPYTNNRLNMFTLIELIMKLRSKPFAEVKDKKNPFDLIAGIIKNN